MRRVTVTGGGGYVGATLVPLLINKGYWVTVLDTFWYGGYLRQHDQLTVIPGDIRDEVTLMKAFRGADAVIHLACISNDPSFELSPGLGKSINYNSFPGILKAVSRSRVKRFIYASSSSVYGVKDQPNVTETTKCDPLTDYSKYKLLCEDLLKSTDMPGVCWTIARPATVCGYSPRMRFDLAVNVLTISALVEKKIRVFGGDQLRPNIHVRDMAWAYVNLLETKENIIAGKTYNIGFENKSIEHIAKIVFDVVNNPGVKIEIEPSNDPRSYHVNSDKIFKEIGFRPGLTVADAVRSIVTEYRFGRFTNPLNNPHYYNIKQMKQLDLEGEYESSVQLPSATVLQS